MWGAVFNEVGKPLHSYFPLEDTACTLGHYVLSETSLLLFNLNFLNFISLWKLGCGCCFGRIHLLFLSSVSFICPSSGFLSGSLFCPWCLFLTPGPGLAPVTLLSVLISNLPNLPGTDEVFQVGAKNQKIQANWSMWPLCSEPCSMSATLQLPGGPPHASLAFLQKSGLSPLFRLWLFNFKLHIST